MTIRSVRTPSLAREPEITPSILASVPECLRDVLKEAINTKGRGRRSVLISSNNLTNRFIFSRWGIRPSQRRRYKNLFASVRKQSRVVFQHFLLRGRIEWTDDSGRNVFGVYKFDEIRGNLILGFVMITPESEWTLSKR
ncbi:MAG: hypothetical protein ACFFCX_00545 [Candidatus Sifarchaeia archaeon]